MIKLIPVLSKQDKQGIIAYYTVYEKYAEEFSKKATEDLKNHPVFGKLIKDIPKEVSAERDKLSRELQKDAIINDNWQPYIEYQIGQGIAYAKMGLDFISWYEVVVLVKNYMRPYLHQEYGSGAELLSSLNGMNRFMDIAMGIIGEAYMREKQGIIQEDREKIKKLNEELEQKVIERTAELLQVNKELLQKDIYFNQSHDMLCTATLQGYFQHMNDSFERELGYTKEELSASPIVSFLHPDDIEKTIKEIEKLASGATTFNFENRYRCKTGKYIWLQWSVVVFENLMYATGRNITAQKIQQEELANQSLKLEQLNKELESFSYSVSHDLRAPLRGIHGYTRILYEDFGNELSDEAKRVMNKIMDNAKKMGHLIDDLLAFSRLGRKELMKMNLSMNEIVSGIYEELKKNEDHRDITFNINNLPLSFADSATMKQVWINLLSNALKYSKRREKTIIEIGSQIKGGEIIYYIKDNGAGFDMRYADKLFGVFQRLHSDEEFEGTGVGLAIVQRIISKHGGRVWAEGKVNEGAVFYFSLGK